MNSGMNASRKICGALKTEVDNSSNENSCTDFVSRKDHKVFAGFPLRRLDLVPQSSQLSDKSFRSVNHVTGVGE